MMVIGNYIQLWNLMKDIYLSTALVVRKCKWQSKNFLFTVVDLLDPFSYATTPCIMQQSRSTLRYTEASQELVIHIQMVSQWKYIHIDTLIISLNHA